MVAHVGPFTKPILSRHRAATLSTLCGRRSLGHLKLEHAAALVRVLAGASQRAAAGESADAAVHSLQLLSRWAAQLCSRASQAAPGDAAVTERLLSQAASHASELLAACGERPAVAATPALVASAVLLLGHASQGATLMQLHCLLRACS